MHPSTTLTTACSSNLQRIATHKEMVLSRSFYRPYGWGQPSGCVQWV